MIAPRPSHEQHRLAALGALDVLDTPPEESFDRITRLAVDLFDVPIAMVSLTDADGQWNTSLVGTTLHEVERDVSFCAHVILSGEVLVVDDAREDPRFADSPLVLDEPHARFYAGAPLRLPSGHNLGALCIMDRQPRSFGADQQTRLRDLAALVVDELQHRRTQTHRLHLFEAHPQPMWIYDVETLRFLDVNAAAIEAYGYPRDHFLRMTLADIRPEADVPALLRSVREASDDGREHSGTWRHRTHDGRLLDVEITSYPITFQDCNARHVQVTDVTEQRRTERALHLRDAILKAAGTAADRFLRASRWETAIDEVLHRLGEAAEVDRVYLFENEVAPDGTLHACQRYEWAAPGVAPQIDNPVLQNLSYEALEAPCWIEAFRRHEPVHGSVDTFPEAMAALLRQQDVQAVALVPVFVGEHCWGFVGFDDCHRRQTWSEPEVEALKVIAGTLGAAIHRQHTEAALREREESYRNLFDSVNDAVYIQDRGGRFLAVNQGAADMYGYEREDFVGETPAMLSAPELNDLEATMRCVERALEGQTQRLEWWGRRADGEIFPKEVMLHRGTYRGETVVIATARDISERLKAEEQLRESEVRFRTIFEQAPLGMALIDERHHVTRANEALARMLGYERDALIDLSLTALTFPEDLEAVRARTTTLFDDAGTGYEVERRFRRADGNEVWIQATTAIVRDDQGRADYVIGMFEDVTERKKDEQQLVEAKEHAEEMNRLKSAFLANMSHEIRTPLTAISGFAEILAEEVDPDNREFVELIRDSSRRLMDTLNSILDLAQLESKTICLQPATLDLNNTLAAILQPYYPQAAEQGLDLRLETPAEPMQARLDPAVLERVLGNLVANALKFTHEGHVAVLLSHDAQGRIALRVEDTGVGIASSFLPHIFDEFQQESSGLTRDYEGTGLGLTITRRLVGLMDGTVEVTSTKGQGTTVTVTLPGLEDDQAPQAPAPAHHRDKPHVLVVEDNAYGGRLMQKVLEKSYHVELVTSGQTALEQAERHRYDVVLMDISLGTTPDGEEVMRRLRRRPAYAATPIVAVTAHVLPGDETHLLTAGFDAYVSKPFTRQALLSTLQHMLNGEAP